ncbi:MAG: KAP family NTPase [Ruminococcus sp.]|uniref:P-loop NTPase fold protein n=1 Tax=Ruminococcus sp. TaxID=41978 RepID=UPI0025D75B6A|nr:P-loop NTPase fold protein [Ruminococcus sp.]MCR4794901.1 KAP family NTPase [Ruminococcus sp.]
MTYDELNSFLLNYLKNDITGRAIMLSGEWGSGKSHYVKNELKPYLVKKNKKCVIVSLYGLSDTTEISKAIFLELHPVIKKLSPAKKPAKVIGKTLLNAVASKIGFDIENPNEETLKQLYKSINLSGTLIVLEDIERTQIEITKLLGYVNNLCENDRAKVLLVTNESELLTTYEGTDGEGKKIRYYTESAIAYKRVKEKTVGDTICFVCDFKTAIQTIIETFGIHLKKFNTEARADGIIDIFMLLNSFNLRAFIYGCQKCKDIFEFISDHSIAVNEKIEEMIFYGIIAFTQRQSKSSDLKFDTKAYLSGRLGVNDNLPLFRFCYDYIMYQNISEEEINRSVAYYTDYLKKGKWNSGRDKDLQLIRGFNVSTEEKTKEALANIPIKIKNGSIPYYDYGILVNYIVAIKYDAEIDFDIESIITPIIDSLKTIGENIDFESLFSSGYTLFNKDGIEYFKLIKCKMQEALTGIHDQEDFPYSPIAIKEYCKNLTSASIQILRKNGFANNIDVNRFISMLKKCSSEVISRIRSLFMDLYRDEHYSQIAEEDLTSLKIIHDAVSDLNEYAKYDKIQKMQIRWFITNLADMITAFENQKAK